MHGIGGRRVRHLVQEQIGPDQKDKTGKAGKRKTGRQMILIN
jgi:hypothetical protein